MKQTQRKSLIPCKVKGKSVEYHCTLPFKKKKNKTFFSYDNIRKRNDVAIDVHTQKMPEQPSSRLWKRQEQNPNFGTPTYSPYLTTLSQHVDLLIKQAASESVKLFFKKIQNLIFKKFTLTFRLMPLV